MSELGDLLKKNVRLHAAQNPGFVYDEDRTLNGCYYVKNGDPSCLIGHALWDAGLIGDEFEKSIRNVEDFETVAGMMDLDLSDDEVHWLGRVQVEQDDRRPWREAVEIADARA